MSRRRPPAAGRSLALAIAWAIGAALAAGGCVPSQPAASTPAVRPSGSPGAAFEPATAPSGPAPKPTTTDTARQPRPGVGAAATRVAPPDWESTTAASLVLHVRAGAVGGDGTSQRPYPDIGAALDRVARRPQRGAGVTIRVAGVIAARQQTTVSAAHAGRSGSPLVIDGGGGAAIDLSGGPQASKDDWGSVSCLSLSETSYVVVRDLGCRNNGGGNGITIWGGGHIRITGSRVENVHNAGIVAMGAYDTSTPSTVRRVTDVLIDGNHVERVNTKNSGKDSTAASGIYSFRSDHVTMSGNTVRNTWGEGINCLLSRFCTVRGNTVTDNYSVGIYLDNSADSTVERNLVTDTADTTYRRKDANALIQVANEVHRLGDRRDSIQTARVTIKDNVTVGGGTAFFYGSYYCDEQPDPAYWCGMRQVRIIHNTFARLQRLETSPRRPLLVIRGTIRERTMADVVVANNIVAADGRSNPDAMADVKDARGITFTHNLWSSPPPAATGGEGDLHGDPRFVGPLGQDPAGYRLGPGSPARGTAEPRFSSEPDGPRDMGAT